MKNCRTVAPLSLPSKLMPAPHGVWWRSVKNVLA